MPPPFFVRKKKFSKACQNKNFIILSLNFGLFTGVMSIIGTIVGITIVNFGYQANIAGLLGASMIVGGIIGSIIIGNALQSNGKFLLYLSSHG